MIDRTNQVVDLLTLVDCRAGDYKLHYWPNHAGERTTSRLNHRQRRIVGAIRDKNDFESRIILSKDRVDILAQALIDSAQRHEDGDEGREFRVFFC